MVVGIPISIKILENIGTTNIFILENIGGDRA